MQVLESIHFEEVVSWHIGQDHIETQLSLSHFLTVGVDEPKCKCGKEGFLNCHSGK